MPAIIVCDDESPRASDLRSRLRARLGPSSGFDVRALSPAEFVDAIAALEARQLAARDGEVPESGRSPGDHPFDTADILFIDYDLLRLSVIGSPATGADSGERVSYLARCYSRCGTIVAYNQFPPMHRSFDLTLRGHLRSFADLNVSMDAASDSGLWSDRFRGFRPWSWPVLTVAYRDFRARTNGLDGSLDEPILATLGLQDDAVYELLTREQLEFLSPDKDPRTASFRDFALHSGNGLRPRDKPWEERAIAGIAAARIGKWLERAILPHQNVLVDAPHLISRFPSLLVKSDSPSAWNASCRLTVPRKELGLNERLLKSSVFKATEWLSRPAWLWPSIACNQQIAEVKDPWAARDVRLVFCEDTSRFRPGAGVKEFVAEVAPEFGRRYVQVVSGVTYEPAVRLLMQA
jgi:hypothetical protein